MLEEELERMNRKLRAKQREVRAQRVAELKKKESFRVVVRNDLKYRTMALYKAMVDSDLVMFDQVDQGIANLATVKGIALEESSIESYENCIIEEN